ncbi:MAG TPA: PAS domain-containing protein, partial [Amaricoccus sp.]|nr:PAS domain-containing protein [Amaricoccus sp.]
MTSLELIDSLPVAAFATDAEGRVVRHNAAAAAIWGGSPGPEARWSGAWRLRAADGTPVGPEATPAARTLAAGAPPAAAEPAVMLAERPDGSCAAFVPRPALLTDAAGRVSGVVELMLDPATGAEELAAASVS